MTYNEFIKNILNTRGRFEIPEGEYKERHHIMPRCMGGGDEEENLIDLYAREHFIAHKLLAEENKNNVKLQRAFGCMTLGSNRSSVITAEEYEYAREQMYKTFKGEGHPNYGGGHLSEDAKMKIGAATGERTKGSSWFNNGEIEIRSKEDNIEGFVKGRLPSVIEKTSEKLKTILKCRKRPERDPSWNQKISDSKKNKPNYKLRGKTLAKEHKNNLSESLKKHWKDNYDEKVSYMHEYLHNDTVRKKISKSIKERQSGPNHPSNKKVICIDTGEEFYSIKEASKALGVSKYVLCTKARKGERIEGKLYFILEEKK